MRLTVITITLYMLMSYGIYGDDGSLTLSDDATRLATKGTQWTSDILDLSLQDGSMTKSHLELAFTPITQREAKDSRHAKANLYLSSPTAGLPGIFSVSTSIGSSQNDVRLQQKGDVRTMTVTRSMDEFPNLDVNSRRYRKTQSYFDSKAIIFTYELKGDTLTLNGFPKTPIVWGSCEFTAPQSEIVFRVRQVK